MIGALEDMVRRCPHDMYPAGHSRVQETETGDDQVMGVQEGIAGFRRKRGDI